LALTAIGLAKNFALLTRPLLFALDQHTATEKTMSPETYAAALVKHVTGNSPAPWFWKGTNSMVTWIVSTFAPRTAFVSHY
jgi:hypothetical protein